MTEPLLYKQGIDIAMINFYRAASRETSIQELAPIIEQMQTYDLLATLIKDPSNDMAQNCLRDYIAQNREVPHEFLAKFLAIINLKINLAPNSTGFINQSYNAKVIANNIRPPTKITDLTLETRKERLLNDLNNNTTFTYVHRSVPQTIRLKFDNDLLKKCINTLGDLNKTIHEGNLANDYSVDEYIHTNMSR